MADVPEDVKVAAERAASMIKKYPLTEAGIAGLIQGIVESALADRLTRPDTGARKAALEEVTASARFARLMEIVYRIIWTDLGKPAMDNPRTQTALLELSEFVLQDALEQAHQSRALSDKGGADG